MRGTAATHRYRMLDGSTFVNEMHQREPGMTESHARTGVAHYDPGLLTLCPFVAMDRATRACRFGLFVGTLFKTSLCIGQEILALATAHDILFEVMIGAVDFHHLLQGEKFPCQPSV